MSNLKPEPGQTLSSVSPCASAEKTITISLVKYEALLNAYRKLAVAFKRRAADTQRDAELFLQDLDLQLGGISKLR